MSVLQISSFLPSFADVSISCKCKGRISMVETKYIRIKCTDFIPTDIGVSSLKCLKCCIGLHGDLAVDNMLFIIHTALLLGKPSLHGTIMVENCCYKERRKEYLRLGQVRYIRNKLGLDAECVSSIYRAQGHHELLCPRLMY